MEQLKYIVLPVCLEIPKHYNYNDKSNFRNDLKLYYDIIIYYTLYGVENIVHT